ncbi:hypothetical protein Rhopal_001547-T1 [Rhodotorula paludigena]|uniref:Transcription factor domain-containing protein n=1 Tax=Rhodotorula paludigena TaxID=86838 RepID=A0AAV5G7P0_9BASI|nr:hypothetical protein Rhopal_001547-T1 [Rhodotorula paludigena]
MASTSAALDGDYIGSPSPLDNHPGDPSKGKKKERDDDDADDGDAPAKKRRNRKSAAAGGACRDRQEGHLCEWEGAIRLPQPHLTRDAEAQELRIQLDRLETLLGGLGSNPALAAAAAAAGIGSAEGGAQAGVAEENAAEALGLLAANTATGVDRSPIAQSAVHRVQVMAAADSLTNLVNLLPVKRELEVLINRFLDSEINFLPVVHVPTFKQRVQAVQYATLAQTPFLLALFFAIAAVEMAWQLTEMLIAKKAVGEKDMASRRFFEASLEALKMGGYLEQPNIDVVRTLLVLHRFAEMQTDERAPFLLGQTIQVAQNRDPAGVEGFTPIDVEDRRRLWRSLVALDWLDYSPRPCAIMPAQFDTREPINAFDQNITLQGVKASERFDLTPALFTNTQSQLAIVGHTLNEYVYAVKPSAPLAWKFFLDQNTTLGRLRSSLVPLAWNGDTVAPLEAKNFATDRFRVFLHMTALQLVIRLNRPFLTRGLADTRLKEGRTRCVEAAHQLIGLWLSFRDESTMSRFQYPLFHCLNGLILAAVDLFQDPHGPHSEKHRRLIAVATARLQTREQRSRLVGEVLRALSILDRNTAKVDDLIEPAVISPTPPAPLDPSTIFTAPFPVSLTADPFALTRAAALAEQADEPLGELATVWLALADGYKSVYAVPDHHEWQELLKASVGPAQGGTAAWSDGIDLLV